MKYMLFSLVLLFFASSKKILSQDSLQIKKVVIDDTIYLIKVYDINNRIHVEEIYVNNIKNKLIAYHSNGSIYYEYYYDSLKGQVIKTIFYDNNKASKMYIYQNDSTQQITQYYDNGNIASIGVERCSKTESSAEEYSCGLIGIWRHYFRSGKIQFIGAYLPEYIITNEFIKDKNIIETIETPKRHGVWLEFDENGQIKKYSCYEFGIEINCN